MAITHDRYFLDNVAGWILELDRGQVRSTITMIDGSSDDDSFDLVVAGHPLRRKL